jgi:hypothetical protein
MDPFHGKLNGMGTSKDEVRICLDGDTGDILVGGHGHGGDIVLVDDAGIPRIRLDAGGAEPATPIAQPGTPSTGASGRVETSTDTVFLSGATGAIRAGGNNQTGTLELKGPSGGSGITMSGAGRLTLQPTPNSTLIPLASSITVDGGDSSIHVATKLGETLRLDGASGNIWLGGNDIDGDLLLMPKEVKGDITDTAKAAIWLDAGERTIRLRSADSKDRIRLEADGGKIVVGGNDVAGDLLVYAADKKGGELDEPDQAAIWIRGGQGDILLTNSDCAEDFDVSGSEEVEPGTVMVLDREGKLVKSTEAYDKKVAGIISGAGQHRPGIVLGRTCTQNRRLPVALVGKAYCKVDARDAPIEVGDLLTTSTTQGHAMKASDPLRAFGAVIGKALHPLSEGIGLIPVLIALQ